MLAGLAMGMTAAGIVGCDTSLGELRDAAIDEADAGARDAGVVSDAPRDASGGDDGADDAGVDAGSDAPDAGPGPSGRVLYTAGRAQSPLTEDLAEGLRTIAARTPRRDDVVSRVGDSITRSTSFLNCFAGTSVNLDGRTELRATIDWFDAGMVGGANPFTRASLAATDGWSASAALAGSPSPLAMELAAAQPGYVSLMFGTNDVGFRAPSAYAGDMLDIVDAILMQGGIPLMSTIPPRDDSAMADARVPLFNAIVRGIAQGRGVPLVDFHGALLPLAGHGLAGDRVHPNTFSGGSCVFTGTGLGFGYPQRNLLVITALDRARRVVAGDAAPDGDVPRMAGSGSSADPFVIDRFPFTDLRDTARTGSSAWASYPACSPANEGGPELVYRLVLDRAARIHAWVFDRGATDVDVHLIDGSAAPSGCLARDDEEVSFAAGPGTYTLSVDSYVDGGGAVRSGEYLLVVLLE